MCLFFFILYPENFLSKSEFFQSYRSKNGNEHSSALNPKSWTSLTLSSKTQINETMGSFIFSLPKLTDYTGLLPGQYVQVFF